MAGAISRATPTKDANSHDTVLIAPSTAQTVARFARPRLQVFQQGKCDPVQQQSVDRQQGYHGQFCRQLRFGEQGRRIKADVEHDQGESAQPEQGDQSRKEPLRVGQSHGVDAAGRQ